MRIMLCSGVLGGAGMLANEVRLGHDGAYLLAFVLLLMGVLGWVGRAYAIHPADRRFFGWFTLLALVSSTLPWITRLT